MSGFTYGGRFELTHTKAHYWHGKRGCCRSLVEIANTHLAPAGFAWSVGRGGNFIEITGPGLSEENTAPMYEAVSGNKSWT